MKNFLKKFGFAMILTLTLTSITFAQGSTTPPPTTRPEIVPDAFTPGQFLQEELLIPNASGIDAPQEQFFGGVLLPVLTKAIIALAGGFAFVFMIVGGIQILTAYGNEEKVSAGKKTMTYAIVGLLIALLAYAVVSIISGVRLAGTPQPTNQGGTTTESTSPNS